MTEKSKRPITLYVRCHVYHNSEYGCGMYSGGGSISWTSGDIEFEIGDHWSGEDNGFPCFSDYALELDGDSRWPEYLKPLTDYFNMEIVNYGWDGFPRTLTYKFKDSDKIITPIVRDDDGKNGPRTPNTLMALLDSLGFDVTVDEVIEDDYGDDY